jgi:hypothetical protein
VVCCIEGETYTHIEVYIQNASEHVYRRVFASKVGEIIGK